MMHHNPLFIESICLINGQFRNLSYHQERVNRTLRYFFDKKKTLNLEKLLSRENIPQAGKLKCRMVYGSTLKSVIFTPYTPRLLKSVKPIICNTIDYAFKYKNRKVFDTLKKQVKEDEVIIVKDGFLTDTTYSNLAFYDGKNWFTPSTPLLPGIMRQSLLDSSRLTATSIRLDDLNNFRSFKLINAMLDLKESPHYDISIIKSATNA